MSPQPIRIAYIFFYTISENGFLSRGVINELTLGNWGRKDISDFSTFKLVFSFCWKNVECNPKRSFIYLHEPKWDYGKDKAGSYSSSFFLANMFPKQSRSHCSFVPMRGLLGKRLFHSGTGPLCKPLGKLVILVYFHVLHYPKSS